MTMREKLIAQLQEMGVGCCQYAGDREVAAEIVDAILTTLREPDDGMREAGAEVVTVGGLLRPDKPLPTLRNAFTAMIDHIRSGK